MASITDSDAARLEATFTGSTDHESRLAWLVDFVRRVEDRDEVLRTLEDALSSKESQDEAARDVRIAEADHDMTLTTTKIIRAAVTHYEESRLLQATVHAGRCLDETAEQKARRDRLQKIAASYFELIDVSLANLIERMHDEVAPESRRVTQDIEIARESAIGFDEYPHRGLIVDGVAYACVQDPSGAQGLCVRRVETEHLVEIGLTT